MPLRNSSRERICVKIFFSEWEKFLGGENESGVENFFFLWQIHIEKISYVKFEQIHIKKMFPAWG